MALLTPFRGIRYNPEQIASLADVVSPPYDVISPSAQAELHARSPFNVVRLELGQAEPGDGPENNPHTRAGNYLRRWLAEGVLIQEAQPALYLAATTFASGGTSVTRWGLMAGVRLEPFEHGGILPHERTYSKVKSERLSLMRACRANLSPIFGFFSDPDAMLPRLVARATASAPTIDFQDGHRHRHRMWVVSDPALHRLAADQVARQTLFIADGHHRYETALAYRDTLAADQGGLPEAHPANYILMYLSSIQDPGLIIEPAHRLLPSVDPEIRRTFLERVGAIFRVTQLPPLGQTPDALQRLQAGLDQTRHGEGVVVVMRDEQTPYLLQIEPGHKAALYPESTPEVLRDIDVTLLTDIIFPRFLAISAEQLDDVDRVRYDQDARRTVDSVVSGRCDMAFIIKPTPIAAVQRIADAGRVMPRKSTYFAPKVITGLVMHALETFSAGSGY